MKIVALLGLIVVLIMAVHRSADGRDSQFACAGERATPEIVAATKVLHRASRAVEAAQYGGSRYAAAKVGLQVDQAEIDAALARRRLAFAGLEKARADCLSHVTA